MKITISILSITLFFSISTIVYTWNTVRIHNWELDHALMLCKKREGLAHIDVYQNSSNFVTCKNKVTLKMDIKTNHK